LSTDAEVDIDTVDGVVMDGDSSDGTKQGASTAPYMSYKGFKNLIVKFDGAPPGRFDSSYFGNASGSYVAQVRTTLKYFDLIDDDKHPTDLLKDLAAANEGDRQLTLKMMFEEKYADALALSANATSGQLAEVFRTRGLSGATIQKAIAFFLGMAEDVGVDISPHFKKGRAVATSNSGTRRRTKRALPAPPSPPAGPTPPPPPSVSTAEQQKVKYVDMLMALVQSAEPGAQPELLDRIERALGYDNPPATKGGAEGS